MEVPVSIDFAQEKKLFFTGFAHRKPTLWISCEWSFDCECFVSRAPVRLNTVSYECECCLGPATPAGIDSENTDP